MIILKQQHEGFTLEATQQTKQPDSRVEDEEEAVNDMTHASILLN